MTHEHDDAHHNLEDAALLPEGDPRRREIEEGFAGAPAQRAEAWRALLAENDELRRRLLGVEPPPGLVDRVRRIREETPRPLRSGSRAGRGLLIAAAVLVVAAIGVFVARNADAAASARAIERLATLAALDHAARPDLSIRTDNPDRLGAALRPGAPFDLQIQSPDAQATLTGGRVCSFGDRPLVYTCWREGDHDVAVYQVRRREFGIRAGLDIREVSVPEQGSPVSRCRVRIWSDDQFAFVVVHDQRRDGG